MIMANRYKYQPIFLLVLFLCLISVTTFAQLSGPSPVTVGQTYNYSYLAGSIVALPTWQAANVTIGTKTQTGLHYTANITFNVVGTTIVYFYNGGTLLANLSVTVNPAPPSAPVASAATTITTTSFNANWGSVTGATGYRLDVSTTSGFTTFVTGYNNLSLTATIKSVTGLTDGTNYYYRVRGKHPVKYRCLMS